MSMLPFIEKSKLLSERTIFDHLNSEKKYETESAQDFIKLATSAVGCPMAILNTLAG